MFKIIKKAYLLLSLLCWPALLFAGTSGLCRDTTASLTVADPLQSNMVLQENKPFKVWGRAIAGKTVVITASWLQGPVTVIANDEGRYLGTIIVPAAKKGDYATYTLSVSSGEKKIVLDNLLIGDVWFCSGQSNMQFPMHDLENADKKIDSVHNPHLRVLNVSFSWHTMPTDTFPGKWQEAAPGSIGNFSAVGYYFASELQAKLDIPIGVIYSGVGGSVTQAYVARDAMASDSLLNAYYLEPFYQSKEYKKDRLNQFTFGTTSEPYLIYNGMIYPFFNLSIKGILWYQGESNRQQREEYVKLNYLLIESWRKNFGQGDLPFYYVQMAPHAYQNLDSTLNDYAYFREEQEKISRLSNTAMAVTMDVGDPNNIHPKNKKPVGHRLAAIALNRTYNQLNVDYLGPHYDTVSFWKRKAQVTFEKGTAKGLKTNDGKAPKYFFMAGTDQVFHYADARIEGNTIVLTCKAVKWPVAVRYAFTNYPVTNLENGSGLPAVPFRTDNWPEVTGAQAPLYPF